MFALNRFACAALLAASLTAQAQQTSIAIDGNGADWAAVPALASATGQAAQAIKAVVRDSQLYVAVQGQQLESGYNLFIDTDGKAATGYQASNSWSRSGAEFLLAAGILYRSTGPGWSWAQVATGTGESDSVAAFAGADAIEARIPLAALGLTASTAAAVGFGIQTITPTWSVGSVLPKVGAFARLTPDAPANAGNGPAFPVGKGLIVPAYITLDDAANWNLLKEGAELMTARKNPNFTDFWVAVNSGSNGPFRTQAEWLKAKTVWDPIRAKGGRIFGYIHTVQSPDMSKPEGRKYRDLATVKADVAAWVEGYPDLDGIWIDEFYPRYEIAQPEAGDALVYPRDYPNGVQYAPVDKGFINELGQFNGQQVDPAGGYYHQLTSWIRDTYPQLRLIGNAGGDLYSNQYRYGDLVDVLVSFEQNFETAYTTGIRTWQNGTVVETERYQWHGLDRLNTLTRAPGFLALIHGNSGNMALAIDQALSHGYTHVYTTDRTLRHGGTIDEGNIWGGLATYLMSQIEYLSAKP